MSAWLIGLLALASTTGAGCSTRHGYEMHDQEAAGAPYVANEPVVVAADLGPSTDSSDGGSLNSRQTSPGELELAYLAAPLADATRYLLSSQKHVSETSGPAASRGAITVVVDEQAPPSVAAVMLADASRELESDELGNLRGGFLLSPGVAMRMVMEFRAQLNGGPEQSFSIPSGFSGVLTGVRGGVPFVHGTNQFSGLISLVDNNLDFQQINALTTVRFDLFGSMSAVRGSLLRSHLNFNASLQPR